MSIGDLPGPSQQQKYEAMLAAASTFISNAQNLDLNTVNRQSDDCIKLLAIVDAATSLYNQFCNI